LQKALLDDDPKFFLELINSFRHPELRPSKLERIALQAWVELPLGCTWEELKTATETIAGRTYDPKSWRDLRKRSPFCDFFPPKRGGK
jgi:hypothetical protein